MPSLQITENLNTSVLPGSMIRQNLPYLHRHRADGKGPNGFAAPFSNQFAMITSGNDQGAGVVNCSIDSLYLPELVTGEEHALLAIHRHAANRLPAIDQGAKQDPLLI